MGFTATLALAGVLVYVFWPGPDLREGSEPLGDARVRVASRTLSSYGIVYRVESRAGGAVVVSTDRLVVRRPFEARSQNRSGPPPGGKEQSETVNALTRLKTGRLTLAVPPAPASLDRRPDAFFPEVVKAGYASEREVRRVAGRRCRIYRMAGDAGALSLAKAEKATDTYNEVCVDEAGLVLEEIGVTDGKLLTRRLAVEVDEDPDIEDGSFDPGEPSLEVRQGGGAVRQLTPDSPAPGTFWELGAPPEGFEHRGRYSVVPPQTGFDDPTQRQRLIAFASDVWVDGVDVLIVEQGATLGGTAPFAEDPNAQRVRVGELGRGELVYGFASTEVRVLRDGGRFVRVFGTLAPSRLLAAARSLEEKEGGTLVFLDERPT